MRPRPITIRFFLALVGLLSGWFIATLTTSQAEVEPTPQLQLQYQLAWQNSSEPIVNNLGYTIELDQLELVNASLELIHCPGAEDHLTPTPAAQSWLAPAVAYAGHTPGEADLSRWFGPLVESWPALTPSTILSITLDHWDYCELHYLVAPDETGRTLTISGRFTSPNTPQATPFEITTDLAWGAFFDVPTTPAGSQMTLTIQRDLPHLFDNIDFEQMTAEDQARTILRTLMAHSSVVTHQEHLSP